METRALLILKKAKAVTKRCQSDIPPATTSIPAISSKTSIHHMNPVALSDVVYRTRHLMDPEYLICTARQTHNAIHYGDEGLLSPAWMPRSENDTCPWKKLPLKREADDGLLRGKTEQRG